MLLGSFQVLYRIYASRNEAPTKGILAAEILCYKTLIAFPTFFYLTTLKKLIQQVLLLDTMLIATLVAMIAFVNLMLLFDTGSSWHYKAIESAFTIQLFLYSTTIRVMFLSMHWNKWQVIVFKLHLMVNALMYFVCGIYRRLHLAYRDFSDCMSGIFILYIVGLQFDYNQVAKMYLKELICILLRTLCICFEYFLIQIKMKSVRSKMQSVFI